MLAHNVSFVCQDISVIKTIMAVTKFKGPLEIFKFCLCVSIPIGMSVVYADSDLMHKLGDPI